MKNRYEIRGDVTAIFIESKKYGLLETLIDTADLPKVQAYPHTWGVKYKKDIDSFYVQGYMKRDGKHSSIQLHRYITDAPPYLEVDHINHNTLDNRRSQLRLANRSENTQNRKGPTRKSKSGVRGVYWDEYDKIWVAKLVVDNKKVWQRKFKDLEVAKEEVKKARAKFHPFSKEARVCE